MAGDPAVLARSRLERLNPEFIKHILPNENHFPVDYYFRPYQTSKSFSKNHFTPKQADHKSQGIVIVILIFFFFVCGIISLTLLNHIQYDLWTTFIKGMCNTQYSCSSKIINNFINNKNVIQNKLGFKALTQTVCTPLHLRGLDMGFAYFQSSYFGKMAMKACYRERSFLETRVNMKHNSLVDGWCTNVVTKP
jgi:hypothetical protein